MEKSTRELWPAGYQRDVDMGYTFSAHTYGCGVKGSKAWLKKPDSGLVNPPKRGVQLKPDEEVPDGAWRDVSKKKRGDGTSKAFSNPPAPFGLEQGAWTVGGIGLGGVASQVIRAGIEAGKASSAVVPWVMERFKPGIMEGR